MWKINDCVKGFVTLVLNTFTSQRTQSLQKTGKVWCEVKDYGTEIKTGGALSFHNEVYSLDGLRNDGNNYRN